MAIFVTNCTTPFCECSRNGFHADYQGEVKGYDSTLMRCHVSIFLFSHPNINAHFLVFIVPDNTVCGELKSSTFKCSLHRAHTKKPQLHGLGIN